VAARRTKNFATPDDLLQLPKMTAQLVELGDVTLSKLVNEPGWRWSEHIRPSVGGEWCQVRHMGFVLSGQLGIMYPDGTEIVYGPDDVFEIAPGHDGYTVGDEPCVQILFAGNRPFFDSFLIGSGNRVLATVLFTDLVDSTATASEVGDARWRGLLSEHFVGARAELERYRGREVKTTGDGLLATFDSPAQALRCAVAIQRLAHRDGLLMRAGVHIGEVELVDDDIRGVTVHEASRIVASARADEILVSDLIRTIAETSGLRFEDRGTHELKGLAGEWHLSAFLPEP
jgi:Adenylate and Guanylate cyclase catalytic domain